MIYIRLIRVLFAIDIGMYLKWVGQNLYGPQGGAEWQGWSCFYSSKMKFLLSFRNYHSHDFFLSPLKFILNTPQNVPFLDIYNRMIYKSLNISTIFTELDDHMRECSFEDNHVFNLIKLVSRCYSKVRFHHLASTKSLELKGNNIRRRLSKLILFKNQWFTVPFCMCIFVSLLSSYLRDRPKFIGYPGRV